MVNFLPADKKSLEEAEKQALAKIKNQKASETSPANDLTRPNFAELSKMADTQNQTKKISEPIMSSSVDSKTSESSAPYTLARKVDESKKFSSGPLSTPVPGPNIISEKPVGFFSGLIKKIFSKKSSVVIGAGTEEETLNVNLLPEQFQQASEIKEKVVFLGALVVSAIILVVAGWGVFSLLTKAKLAERAQYEDKIKTENSVVADLKRQIQETNSRGRQVIAIQQILESRRNILSFLSELEKRTLSTVYYDGLSLADTMNLTLMAKASTLEDATKQYNIFKNSPDLFKSVSVLQFNSKEKGGDVQSVGTTFSLTLMINPEIYQKSVYPFFENAIKEPATSEVLAPESSTTSDQPAVEVVEPTSPLNP